MEGLKVLGYIPVVDGKVKPSAKISESPKVIGSSKVKKSSNGSKKRTQEQLLNACVNVLNQKFK